MKKEIEMVRTLLKWKVEKSSLRVVAKQGKLPLSTLHLFLQGKEITLSSFIKLHDYADK